VTLPDMVQLRDVTLRDGLQSVTTTLPLAEKLAIFTALLGAGVPELQVTSFVNPARLPQLADAPALWSAVQGEGRDQGQEQRQSARLTVLVANARGYQRAVAASALDIEAVLALSESYSQRNANRSRAQALAEVREMLARARDDGARVCVALANSFHCVYDGVIHPDVVLTHVQQLAEAGVQEVMLCDTTGHAYPDAVQALCQQASQAFPQLRFGAHLHDTRGRGLVNAYAALTAGIRWFDAALAGLGGSPFATGLGGNLSLEQLVELLDGLGVRSGVQLAASLDAAALVRRLTGPVPV
jgi:hydroxymethylglutaryl-CoA lyase